MKTLRSFLIVVASGLALTLAFPRTDIAPLAWIALVPLLFECARVKPGKAAALGFAFGLAFFGSLLIWISIVGYVAWAVLVVLQAGFVALFSWVLAFCTEGRARWFSVALAPIAWVAIVEFGRSLVPVGGFTWGELAQSQHDLAWLLKAATLGGGWMVAFLVVLANAGFSGALGWASEREWGRAVTSLGVACLALAWPLVLPATTVEGEPVRVAIVQGNVPEDFQGSFYDKELAITRSHEELTRELAGEDVDLVVWPESSVGIDIRRDPDAAQAVYGALDAVDAPMVVGGNIDVDEDRYKVVAFHLEPGRGAVDVYEKTHLVPFGEYVPARGLFGWIPMLSQVPRDAVPGTEGKVFDVAGGRVAPVISFEGDFGSLARERIDAGGRLLVVATNTSTWERSAASEQHLAFSQVRAAENGVWVAHAALSGVSGFVSPRGEVTGKLDLWTADTSVRDVAFADEVTLYARLGDWLPYLCLLVTAGALASATWRRRKRGALPQPS